MLGVCSLFVCSLPPLETIEGGGVPEGTRTEGGMEVEGVILLTVKAAEAA